MRTSLEKQIKVLSFLREGKKPAEIHKLTHIHMNTICYIRDNGPGNIDQLIKMLRLAVESNVLNECQIRELKEFIGKL
jgi:hypothetical protein